MTLAVLKISFILSLSGVGYSSFSDQRSIESRSVSSTGSQPNFDRPGNKYCAGTKNKHFRFIRRFSYKEVRPENSRRSHSARCPRRSTPTLKDNFPGLPDGCVARQFDFFEPKNTKRAKTIQILRFFRK